MYSSPTIGTDGTVYIGSTDKRLYAFAPDGAVKWIYVADGPIACSPALAADGTIYIPVGNNVYSINPDGSLKWTFTAGARFHCDVYRSISVGDDGTLYATSDPTYLYAINADGTQKWRLNFGPITLPETTPSIGPDGTIYVGTRDRYSTLFAVNPDGTIKWRYEAIGSVNHIFSSPLIDAEGTIYFGADDRNVHAVNPDGTGRWIFPVHLWVRIPVALAGDGTLYVHAGEFGNKLYAIGPGTPPPTPTPTPVPNAPPVAVAGTSLDSGDNLQLDASLSSDPEGDSLAFTWEIAGEPSPRFGQFVSVADLAPGNYQVTLTVSDGELADQDIMLFGVPRIFTPKVAPVGTV